MNLNSNWMKDLRTEVFRRMYEEPIHPANLWLEEQPKSTPRSTRSTAPTSERLIERGTYTPPAHSFPGARYIPMDDDRPAEAWADARVGADLGRRGGWWSATTS